MPAICRVGRRRWRPARPCCRALSLWGFLQLLAAELTRNARQGAARL